MKDVLETLVLCLLGLTSILLLVHAVRVSMLSNETAPSVELEQRLNRLLVIGILAFVFTTTFMFTVFGDGV